ncbi:acyltransferase domain-containing protein [Streptomyces sp. NPDC005877]|uniref:acyltransferase domain-containing protein n=1 Tax=Streptomyces sp. NPDC005877 TaxID=3155346 RepID=UPI0033E014A0
MHETFLGLAAVNGPRTTVVAGELTELVRLRAELADRGVTARPLTVSHAFHSPLMRPAVEPFRAEGADLAVRPPAVPVFSTLYGRVMGDEERMDAAYWARQLTAPVRFADAAAELLACGVTHVVEIGPRAVLTPLLARLRPADAEPVHCLAAHPGERAPRHPLHHLLGELWSTGADPTWDGLYPEADRVPRRLPPYVFDDTFRAWRSATAPEPAAPHVITRETAASEPTAADPAPAPPGGGAPQRVSEVTRRLVCRVGGHDPSVVRDRSRLAEDLGFDSIQVMELKTRVENELPELGSLPVEELLASLETVGDLSRYLTERLLVPAAPAAAPEPSTPEGPRT